VCRRARRNGRGSSAARHLHRARWHNPFDHVPPLSRRSVSRDSEGRAPRLVRIENARR
jgi:hypothetical protein